MKITWVARSFLDYRIPVYAALDQLCGNQLTLIYNADLVPERCQIKIRKALGERAIGLRNEKTINSANASNTQMANVGFSIPYHPDLIPLVRKSAPDVIVSDGYLKWTYASLFVRMFNRKGIKHVMCYERTEHTERNAGWLRTLYRKFAGHWIDAIDCNGTLTAQYVTQTLKYRKPLTFGHMAADTEGIRTNVDRTTQEEIDDIRVRHALTSLNLIYVGQLIPRKGVMEMLRAWEKADLKDATLMLVGKGPQQQEVEDFIRDKGLKSVRIVGAVDYDSLGPYYRSADCFIIPTLEDNWSLVVPEALAAGLPVACSIYNGCHPELVRPENGWTFDPLNIDATAAVLREISRSREKLARMGEASRRIVADYTPAHAAQGIYDACVQVLKS